MEVVDRHRGRGVVALEDRGEDRGERVRGGGELERREEVDERRLERNRARGARGGGRHPLGELRGHPFEGAVLEQPGEEQVAGLEELEVELVLDLPARQQARGLEIEQGGGDEKEARQLLEAAAPPEFGDVGEELVGDLGERDLGDVELALADESEQEVERAGEVLQLDDEPGGAQGAPPRAMSSRASRR